MLPTGPFRTIVVDPPWRYDDRLAATTRGAARHYAVLSLDAIVATPVGAVAGPDAHLYLWTTNAFLEDAHRVARAWGFAPKTLVTWCKVSRRGTPRLGMGRYWRGATEHALFATRGRLPIQDRTLATWFVAPRGRHSAKPDAFYALVERASPGPRAELFARAPRQGWHCWGDELAA